MAEVSQSEAVFKGLCPRCRKGKIFKYPFYSPAHFADMYETCPHCGLRYEIEPGYFWGAMFVSYAFSGGIALFIGFILFYGFNDPANWVYLTIISIALIFFTPINFRISRVLWLHFVSGISYHPNL